MATKKHVAELDRVDDEELEGEEDEQDETEEAEEPKAQRTTKKCAKHGQNFPEEDPIRPVSEFYGKAQSSYCKRCMGIMHKERRQNLKSGVARGSAAYNDLLAAVRTSTDKAVGEYQEVGEDAAEEAFNRFTDLVHDQWVALFRLQTAEPSEESN